MKRNSNGFIWGIILIVVGLFIAGKAFNLFDFTIFFDGWWTLFIIIPCFIGLFSNDSGRMSYLVGLCIGVFLLLSAQDVISWRMFGPLCFAAVLVLTGVNIIFKKDDIDSRGNYTNYTQKDGFTTGKTGEYTHYQSNSNVEYSQEQGASASGNTKSDNNQGYTNSNSSGGAFYSNNQYTNRNGICVCSAVLGGRELKFDNQEFHGAVLSAVLGGIDIDLRNAIIRENVVIEAKTVLGGIDILVPNYVRVSINCTPILGGVDNRTNPPANADASTPTIFINATCVLSGLDVK